MFVGLVCGGGADVYRIKNCLITKAISDKTKKTMVTIFAGNLL